MLKKVEIHERLITANVQSTTTHQIEIFINDFNQYNYIVVKIQWNKMNLIEEKMAINFNPNENVRIGNISQGVKICLAFLSMKL